MSFELNRSRDSRNLDNERIFFVDLSEEAQAKALKFKSDNNIDKDWDVAPLGFLSVSKDTMSQSDMDLEGLVSLGFYR
jgi:hypothetical protein